MLVLTLLTFKKVKLIFGHPVHTFYFFSAIGDVLIYGVKNSKNQEKQFVFDYFGFVNAP